MAQSNWLVERSERVESRVIFSMRGAVGKNDLVTLRRAVAGFGKFGTQCCLLVDWSDLEACEAALPRPRNRTVIESVNGLERVAILHHRALNTRAAYLAALLRSNGVLVRSYRPSDRDRALDWLNSLER
jgi:hypothetical protein